ncbi:MAG: competence/damage-inducible protein A [Streptococcaceae bacterium]|nr:competence/damage-inducible protein A [Streptococcaceae bacterium]
MKAEIIAVGTEVLMGQVINSNAAVISESLNDLGVDVVYHTTVGDNKERLFNCIKQASSRVDLVLLSGGLGPTPDDLTRDVLAQYLNEDLVRFEPGYEKLLDYFAQTGREHTKNNDLQVLTLKNGIALPNETGFAIGTYIEKNETIYVTLPGPPSELIPMLKNHFLPLLAGQKGVGAHLYTRVLRFYGIGESQLVTRLSSLIDTQEQVTIAPYAKTAEVTLRLATKLSENALDEVEKKILQTADVGEFFYGYGDENSLVQVSVDLLKEKGKTITAAESLTAGKFQSSLGDIAGVSSVFKGGFVTYSLETKADFLQIDVTKLAQHGMISEFSAEKMAEQALKLAKSDYALSFTGVAGPDEMEEKKVGTVFIGLARKGQKTLVEECHFPRNRKYIRISAVMKGLDVLRRELLENK